MQKYVALLRGINVSGQKKIVMADLKKALATCDFDNVQTYIQSGNIVFETAESDKSVLSALIEKLILDRFGFEVPVLVLLQDDFHQLRELNVWYDENADVKKLYVGFLYDQPEAMAVKVLADTSVGKDEYRLVYPYLFLKYAEGMGKSKMTNNFFEQKWKIRMTTRNWNTVSRLAEM